MTGTEKLMEVDSYSFNDDTEEFFWESGSVEEYNGEYARDMITRHMEFEEIERFFLDNEFEIIGVDEVNLQSNSNYFSTKV